MLHIGGISVVLSILLVVLRWEVPRLYTPDEAIIEAVAGVFPILSCYMFFDCAVVSVEIRSQCRQNKHISWMTMKYLSVGSSLPTRIQGAPQPGIPRVQTSSMQQLHSAMLGQ